MLKSKRAWQTYFCILVALTTISAATQLRHGAGATAAEVAWELCLYLVDVAGFVGLFGFAWQKAIGRPRFWKLVFGLNVLVVLGVTLRAAAEESAKYHSSFGDALVVVVLALSVFGALIGPYLFALYSYGFRCRRMWGAAAHRREARIGLPLRG